MSHCINIGYAKCCLDFKSHQVRTLLVSRWFLLSSHFFLTKMYHHLQVQIVSHYQVARCQICIDPLKSQMCKIPRVGRRPQNGRMNSSIWVNINSVSNNLSSQKCAAFSTHSCKIRDRSFEIILSCNYVACVQDHSDSL